jgi:uncharacterized DUF497 family protein
MRGSKWHDGRPPSVCRAWGCVLYGFAVYDPVNIEFDDAKDAANIAKHGVSLALGAAVLEGRVGEVVNDRRDYGEIRFNAFGLIAGRLFACTYTSRDGTQRIISVRRASRQEQRIWLS